ncbi:HAMP domain-containing histidine kinase [Lachnospiraceae bacterium MD335]|nr:HAMP domain-containing histidine kinase [Lachnospiraceae bacterium MD335]
MSDKAVIIGLTGMVILLLVIIFYQQFLFKRGIHGILKKISEKLADILERDSDEKVMIFTDDPVLMDLLGQINRMLLDRQKVKIDYRKQELSSKKMLANISHDIKTPLTVILGYLEIMRIGREDDESLQKVEAKAKQVLELINAFFTLAKLEAGDMRMERTKVNLSELCRENVLGFYELLLQKEFTVDISIPEENLFVWGDRDSIDRILTNLLSNAIRYGSDGKYIGIALRSEGRFVYIDVADKGKGIDKAFAASVFERLYTMEDSRNRQIQGNGLGLTIAKNLAQQMGGDVLLESEPHVRTVFTVKLEAVL